MTLFAVLFGLTWLSAVCAWVGWYRSAGKLRRLLEEPEARPTPLRYEKAAAVSAMERAQRERDRLREDRDQWVSKCTDLIVTRNTLRKELQASENQRAHLWGIAQDNADKLDAARQRIGELEKETREDKHWLCDSASEWIYHGAPSVFGDVELTDEIKLTGDGNQPTSPDFNNWEA